MLTGHKIQRLIELLKLGRHEGGRMGNRGDINIDEMVRKFHKLATSYRALKFPKT